VFLKNHTEYASSNKGVHGFFSSIDVDVCDEIQMRMTMIPFFLNFFIAIGNY
jgi:hypothetical protein